VLWDTWKETLLVGRFASRTFVGVLFSSNVAAVGTKSNRAQMKGQSDACEKQA
jgi:hypothetical protein